MDAMAAGSGTVGTCLSQEGYEKALKMATNGIKLECVGDSSVAVDIIMSFTLVICMTLGYVFI